MQNRMIDVKVQVACFRRFQRFVYEFDRGWFGALGWALGLAFKVPDVLCGLCVQDIGSCGIFILVPL